MSTAVATLDCLPSQIRAGDTVIWKRAGGDYKATDGWVITYSFNNGANRYKVEAATDGADHKATMQSSVTKSWMPGTYDVIVSAKDSANERTTIDAEQRTVVVLENLIDGSPKSLDRKIYENIQAVVEGRLQPNADIESSQFNGEAITRMSSTDLMKWLNYYGARVVAEDRRRLKNSGRFSKASF